MLARGSDLDKLTTGQRWQLAYLFRKTCNKADQIGAGAADICRHLVGSVDLMVCAEYIETMCDIDEHAVPPEYPDSVIVLLPPIRVDRRRQIRQGKAFYSIAGPPPPGNDNAPGLWRPRAVSAQSAKSFSQASKKYAGFNPRASAVAETQHFCAFAAKKYSVAPNKNNRGRGWPCA